MTKKNRMIQMGGFALILLVMMMMVGMQTFAAPTETAVSQTEPTNSEPIEEGEDEDYDDYDPFAIVANLIGIELDTLWEAIDNGQTIAEVANDNGVDPQTIIDALVDDEKAYIDELLAAGEISEEEAAGWSAEAETYMVEFVNETFDFEEFEDGDYDEEFDELYEKHDPFPAILELLGMEEDALWEAIDGGQTLAAISQEKGVDPAAIVTLIVDSENALIDELKATGELSEEEAAEWLAEVDEYANEIVYEGFEEFEDEEIEFEDDEFYAPVAELLGMEQEAIWEALESGQSLAQLAVAQGVELQALKDTLIATEEALIDELLTAGEISEEEAAEWRAELPADVDEWVNESWDEECDHEEYEDDGEFEEDFDEDLEDYPEDLDEDESA